MGTRIVLDLLCMILVCSSAFFFPCGVGRAQLAGDIFAKAYAYYQQGEYEAARNLFHLGLHKDLRNLSNDIVAKARYYLAESEMQIGDRNMPTGFYIDANGIKEKTADEARMYQYYFLYGDARSNYEQVISLSPNSVEGIDSVAKTVIAQRKSDESECTESKLEALQNHSFPGKSSLADLKACTCDEGGLGCPAEFR